MGVESTATGWDFVIYDNTDGTFDTGPTWAFSGSGTAPYGSGGVCFTSVPEPSSVALMLLGVGAVFVMRKRRGQGLPQAS